MKQQVVIDSNSSKEQEMGEGSAKAKVIDLAKRAMHERFYDGLTCSMNKVFFSSLRCVRG